MALDFHKILLLEDSILQDDICICVITTNVKQAIETRATIDNDISLVNNAIDVTLIVSDLKWTG